ncbi:MAG TPA: DUF2059 domain-containing protein [Anaeromyxobacter sp.]
MRLPVAVALALFAAAAAAQDPAHTGSAAAGGRAPSPPAAQAPEARKSPPPPAASALARALLPQEQWDRILDRYATSLSGQVSDALSRGGEKVPDDLQGNVRRELSQRLPYQETVEAQAQALAKEFSADEMKKAADFYVSPLGKKVLEKLPDAQTEVAERLQERLAVAVPEIVQHLAPKAIQPPPGGDGAGGSAGAKPPAVQGRKPPPAGPSKSQ